MGLRDKLRQRAARQATRHLDVAVQVVRKKTGETLLCAGGQWDREERCYTGREPEQVRVVKVVESQVEFMRWFARHLEAYATGSPVDVSLGLKIGDRRAGKTVVLLLAGVATCIEVPLVGWHGLLCWAVGVSRPEMQEMDRYLQWLMPAAWYEYRLQEHTYNLAVGSQISTITADNPKTLKRGEANLVLLNEGQKMPVTVLSNAIMGAVDHGGLTLIAANQPEDRRGEWVAKIQRGVRNGTIPATAVFSLSSKDNDEIDQSARGRAASILQVVDPLAYALDVLNQDILQEGKALPLWDPQVHVRPRPQVGLIDITAEATYARVGRAYQWVIGQDYQADPYMPAPCVKVFGSEKLRAVLRGQEDRSALLDPLTGGPDPLHLPHYWICTPPVGEEVVTRKGATEHELCDLMWLAGLRPETAYCVGDATGAQQNSRHSLGDDSFTLIKSRRWHVVPPFDVRTDRDVKPMNPRRPYRIGLARTLVGLPPHEADKRGLTPIAPRLFIEPNCHFGRKQLEECEIGPAVRSKELAPRGFASHYFDAATYVLCHLEPQPEAAIPAGGDLPRHLEEIMNELKARARRSPL